MSPTSFLTTADVADLTAVNLDGFETLATAFPGRTMNVVFGRWDNASQTHIAVPAQRVLIEYADRQERQLVSESGSIVTIDGWLSKPTPFDVERGDLFGIGTTGDEERAEIIQVRPPELGVQRAAFRLVLGES